MTLLLRAKVARAAHDIVPTWPLDSFIAVNPLANGERQPFDHAHQHGAATTRPQGAYVADFRSGRILSADLVAAVTERIPELADADEVTLADLGMTGAELVALELELQQSAPPHRPRLEPKLDRVDQITAKWVAAFLDPEPLWPMPGRAGGLYSAWRQMARHDLDLPRRARRELRSLAERADDALGDAIAGLGISDDDSELVMRAELARLPGWVSHIKWRSEHVGDIDLTAYLALRLSLRRALRDPMDPSASATTPDIGAPEPLRSRAERLVRHVVGTRMLGREEVGAVARMLALHPEREHPLTWQRAYELHYRDELLSSIDGAAQPRERAAVQLVMCIDPRSEGMRRQLERSPWIETVGFAGFFGVPIRFVKYRARGAVNSLPALLSPRHTVTESPSERAPAQRLIRALRVRDAVACGLHAGDRVTAAPFALAETAGWFMGIWAAIRTVVPGLAARIALGLNAIAAPSLRTEVTVADAFTLDERAGMAETAMRMMGLTWCAPL
ncbi:putative inorganic carbon transporter subunit DabA, partial [Salinibacterium sp.]|uniref:putative inorganic carbon transporter subunit DabA n=1 Tax=Salinibacterium sp. TaxID=1915057 RepID=UPI00286CD589